MRLVNWDDYLPPDAGAFVAFSSLTDPDERDEFQRNVAEIRLPQDRVVDVAWDDSDRKYVVTLYVDEYENQLQQTRCDNPAQVIDRVKQLVETCRAKARAS
ncbi:MAG: hypothetical protein HYS13_14795 [Planctomycetia bacterium]|nr:hypothetical protein [Planctomycetia bacterium]